jgi:hypothetical protein
MESGAAELQMEDWSMPPSQLKHKVKNLQDVLRKL